MALQLSTTVRNNRLDSIETTIGASGVTLEIRSGAPPANCAAADTGTLLATVPVPADFMSAAASGAKAIANAPWTVLAAAGGTPGHFRLKTSTTCHIQGTAGVAAGSPDMVLDAATVTAGQSFNVNSFTINDPNG
jgi:hypothetical protein